MNKTLKLHTYDGHPVYFVVENVEDIMCVYTYTASGDECAVIIYTNGDYTELDTNDGGRLLSFGPENTSVLLPADIEWETKPYDA